MIRCLNFRIRSGHLEGLRDASPRLNFSGPLIRNHLYFAEGSEYLIDKAEVRTLPFPVNESRSNAFNSFSQFDAPVGANNSVTATLHFAPHTAHYVNLKRRCRPFETDGISPTYAIHWGTFHPQVFVP